MALKGHKPGCRCVGCSPATRRRGMAALKKGGKSRRKRTRIKYHFEKHGTWSKFKGITRANPLHSFRSFPPGPEWQRYKGYVSKAQAYNIAKNLQAEAPHLEI